jgi:hypothetical protein
MNPYYKIQICRKRGIKQKFHLRIVSRYNEQKIFTSENYARLEYARVLAERFKTEFDMAVEDLT